MKSNYFISIILKVCVLSFTILYLIHPVKHLVLDVAHQFAHSTLSALSHTHHSQTQHSHTQKNSFEAHDKETATHEHTTISAIENILTIPENTNDPTKPSQKDIIDKHLKNNFETQTPMFKLYEAIYNWSYIDSYSLRHLQQPIKPPAVYI